MNIPAAISKELNISKSQVERTLKLFSEGATVPFVARYRKEVTGNLDETVLRKVLELQQQLTELETLREKITAKITELGKMSPELQKKLENADSKRQLEDLYLPYKPRKASKAQLAREKGLEPLANMILMFKGGENAYLQMLRDFTGKIKFTQDEVLDGVKEILIENISERAALREQLYHFSLSTGMWCSNVTRKFKDEKTKFNMYYDHKEKACNIPSHRMLAMLRGEKEKVLNLSLSITDYKALKMIRSYFPDYSSQTLREFITTVCEEAYKRFLLPAITSLIKSERKDIAEEEAFKVFASNLEALLLAPPAGQKVVMGVDPGFRTGCKVVVINHAGDFLVNKTIYPHPPQGNQNQAEEIVLDLITQYQVDLIAVGNGTAGRETESFLRSILKIISENERPKVVMVSESGASIYSASEIAIEEFPDLDLTVRGAISIARRLQDPLSELVKIDPKSIGVGQYQHDVNQQKLQTALNNVVESCVNRVGVNLNQASPHLLQHVAGLTTKTAMEIVNYRQQHKQFKSRQELLKVKGMGAKRYEQAAGFLRIPDAANPLDNSAVHPESYDLVATMAKKLNTGISGLIGNEGLLTKIDISTLATATIGRETINDIIAELKKPGRDPRKAFTYAEFDESVSSIEDLYEGIELEGVVTNVTNFGAFVDIGVHQDGLVHISEMANRFVSDPREIVVVGDTVKVTVIQIDAERKRIALSMKR